MTPFIIWLKKEEIDELIFSILHADTLENIKNKNLSIREIEELYNKVSTQNENLTKLFRKIEPLNPIQKKAAQIYGVKEKCNHYHDQLQKMISHCSLHNRNNIKNPAEIHDLLCENCSINLLI